MLLDSLRQAVGAGIALELRPDVAAGGAQLDGTADDGGGPGRLLVVVTPANTAAQTNLCLDPDFVQRGSCERVSLENGGRLYRRGLVRFGDTQTIVVAIQRPDGAGVLLETDNFVVPEPPELVAGQPRPTPVVSRRAPVFSLDQLVRLAKAVATATEGCSIRRCP